MATAPSPIPTFVPVERVLPSLDVAGNGEDVLVAVAGTEGLDEGCALADAGLGVAVLVVKSERSFA